MSSPFTGGGDELAPDAQPGLDFWAQFKLSLDANTAAVEKNNQYRKEQMKLGVQPRTLTLTQQSTSNAAATDLLDYGCPQPGRKWVVRSWGVYQLPYTTTATTIATLCVGQRIAVAAGVLPAGMVRWQFTGVPNFKDFGPGVIVVNPLEHVLVGLTAKGNTDVIPSFITIEDLPQWAALPVVDA